MRENDTSLTSRKLKKAVRLNRYYARTLNWASDFDAISQRLLGFTNRSPGREAFADAVADWQAKVGGLVVDGILGPNTWARMMPEVNFTPAPPAPPAVPTPKKGKRIKISDETDVTGERNLNDAYDLTLYLEPDGDYTVELFMKIQFFFEDGAGKKWSLTTKNAFVASFVRAIKAKFNGILLDTLDGGEKLWLEIRFQTQIEGWMLDHWEITTRIVPAGATFRSNVQPGLGNVTLTQNDMNKLARWSAVPPSTTKVKREQVTVVHEFAHMLGLGDEYGPNWGGKKRKGDVHKDEQSLLSIGSTLRPRHSRHLVQWVEKTMGEAGP